MAAKNAHVKCAKDTWTQLTDNAGATGDVTVALVGGGMVWIQANTSTTKPTDFDGAFPLYTHGDGWSEATIAEKFPDNANNTHLFAYSPFGDSTVSISHG